VERFRVTEICLGSRLIFFFWMNLYGRKDIGNSALLSFPETYSKKGKKETSVTAFQQSGNFWKLLFFFFYKNGKYAYSNS
jgi:hypothetical protein